MLEGKEKLGQQRRNTLKFYSSIKNRFKTWQEFRDSFLILQETIHIHFWLSLQGLPLFSLSAHKNHLGRLLKHKTSIFYCHFMLRVAGRLLLKVVQSTKCFDIERH